ncbi:HAD domain-containing protein [Simiduia curdlanivorans]|uniref:HAD domain-containing protein n=1 Tax=Simiduia curdlanivorans TaxID=1492769 RepID=A0ABV8UYZ7_9GAMM|nr:HAD domain-containing protein [Simiduia curdlanivorans]MDN3639151.1 HAD domain-containing protein [Simiduia curdlanivorans]
MTTLRPSHLIFLDIDGVLRPDKAYDAKLKKESVDCLKTIARHFNSRIVITSTWRDLHTWEVFNKPHLLDGLVIGETPDLDPMHNQNGRYSEVQAYLKKNKFDSVPWLAFDDKQVHYPVGHPQVYLTNPSTGITRDDVQRIINGNIVQKPSAAGSTAYNEKTMKHIRSYMAQEGCSEKEAVEKLIGIAASIL